MDRPSPRPADRAALSALFADVWAELIPHADFDPALTWAESGVDSLKGLMFWLRLEQALGRPLSFDLMTREMTLGDLIDAVGAAGPLADDEAPGGQRTDHPIFLTPALFGDEPILAEFRRSLADRLRFSTLQLPDIDQPARLGSDMDRVAAFLVNQIIEAQPDGPLYLVGYSLGCVMAFQAANHLIAGGRDVRLVCLLDPPFNFGPRVAEKGLGLVPPPIPVQASLRRTAGEGARAHWVRIAFGTLMRIGWLEPARRLVLATPHLNAFKINTMRRMRLIAKMRGRALRGWRPEPCAAPVLLAVSDELDPYDPVGAWRGLCPDLTVQRLPGEHRKIFEPRSLDILNPALLAAIVPAETA